VQLDVRPISRSVYVVQPGDTMWAIAHRMAPDGDVRPVVDRLVAQLHGRALTPGTRLIVS
jgi:Tfp pilus assembly protein FimV